MAAIHISEAEAARDFASVMLHVDAGDEVVIERGDKPAAVVRSTGFRARTISECIALLPEHSDGVMDEEFARDVQTGIDAHQHDYVRTDWD